MSFNTDVPAGSAKKFESPESTNLGATMSTVAVTALSDIPSLSAPPVSKPIVSVPKASFVSVSPLWNSSESSPSELNTDAPLGSAK